MSEFFELVPDPIDYSAHEYVAEGVGTKFLPEVSLSMRLDWAVRVAIERAVYASQEVILQLMKLLEETGIRQVVSLEPVKVPTSPCSKQVLEGDVNNKIKMFADVVYDFVNDCSVQGWYVIPYFEEGSDNLNTHSIGLFISNEFTQTVVE